MRCPFSAIPPIYSTVPMPIRARTTSIPIPIPTKSDDTIHQPSHHAANTAHQYNDESPQNNQYYINHHLPVNCMRSDRYPPFHIPNRPSRCPFVHVQRPFQSQFRRNPMTPFTNHRIMQQIQPISITMNHHRIINITLTIIYP